MGERLTKVLQALGSKPPLISWNAAVDMIGWERDHPNLRSEIESDLAWRLEIMAREVAIQMGAQPTPDNWKEMSEADKMAFIARNYGPASPPPPTTTPSPPVILPPTTTRVRSRSMASHSTPENWKELRETEKREFITRNYGSLPTYTSGAVPAWDREMSSDRNLR